MALKQRLYATSRHLKTDTLVSRPIGNEQGYLVISYYKPLNSSDNSVMKLTVLVLRGLHHRRGSEGPRIEVPKGCAEDLTN